MGGDTQSSDSIHEGSLHVLELFGSGYTVLTFKEQFVSWLRRAERVNEQLQATRLFSTRLGVDVPVFKKEAIEKALDHAESAAHHLANSLVQWKTPLNLVDKSRPFLVLLPQNQDVIVNLECLSNASESLEREMESCRSLRANSTRRKPVNTPSIQVESARGEQSTDQGDANYSINDLPPKEPGNPLHYKRISRLRSRSLRNLIGEEQSLPDSQPVSEAATSKVPGSDRPQSLYELPVASIQPSSVQPQFTLQPLFPLPELQGDDGLFDIQGRMDGLGQLRYSTITPGIHHLNKADTTVRNSPQNKTQPNFPVAVPADGAESLDAPQTPSISDASITSKPSNNNVNHNNESSPGPTRQIVMVKPGKNLRSSTISTSSLGSPMPPIQEGEPVSNSALIESNTCPQHSSTGEIDTIPSLPTKTQPQHRTEATGSLLCANPTSTNLPQIFNSASTSILTLTQGQMKNLSSSEDPRTCTTTHPGLSQPSQNGFASPSPISRSLPISTTPIFHYPFTTAKSFIIETPTTVDEPSSLKSEQQNAHQQSASDISGKPDTGRFQQIRDSAEPSFSHKDAIKVQPTDVTYKRANSLPETSHAMSSIHGSDRLAPDIMESSRPFYEMLQQRHTFPSQAQTATTLQQLQHQQPISRYRNHVAEIVHISAKGKEAVRNSTVSLNGYSHSGPLPQQTRPPYPVTPAQSPSEIVAKLLPASNQTSQQAVCHQHIAQQTLATAVASISADTSGNRHRQSYHLGEARPSVERAVSETPPQGPYTAYSPPLADIQNAARPMSAPITEHYKAYSTSEKRLPDANQAGPLVSNAVKASMVPTPEDGLIPIPPAIEIAEVVQIQPPRMIHVSSTHILGPARSPAEQKPPHPDRKSFDDKKTPNPPSPAGLEPHVGPVAPSIAVSPPIPPKIPHPQSPLGKISVQFDQDRNHLPPSSSSGLLSQQNDLNRFSQQVNYSPSKTVIVDLGTPSSLDEQRSVSSSSARASTVNAGTHASAPNPSTSTPPAASHSHINLSFGSSADVRANSPSGTPRTTTHSMLSLTSPSNPDRIGGQRGHGKARRRSGWLFAQVEKAGTAALGTGQ